MICCGKVKYFILCLTACFFVFGNSLTRGAELNWRGIAWAPFDYDKVSLANGGSLYTVKGSGEKNFRIDIIFPISIHHFDKNLQPAFLAFVDLLLEGGVKNRTFDEFQNDLKKLGLSVETKRNNIEQLQVSVSGLSQDFNKAVSVIEDIFLFPRYLPEALDIWKQGQQDGLISILDAGNYRKQMRLMAYLMNKVAFGNEHYLTQTLARSAPKALADLTLEQVKGVSAKVIANSGIKVIISGVYPQKSQALLIKTLAKLPKGQVGNFVDIPSRAILAQSNKIKFVTIVKDDMKQSNIEMRFFVQDKGQLNDFEKAYFEIASEVFSATAGVVGNDRWSKAMRADSGFSYSPSALFAEYLNEPNTGTGMWRLIFQSPNDKIKEACVLAKKTWDKFVNNGITQEEMQLAKTSLINKTLAEERTVFDKTDYFLMNLARGKVHNPLVDEAYLTSIDSVNNVDKINEALKKYSSGTLDVMAIMGKPDVLQLKELGGLSEFTSNLNVAYSDLIKEFN